VRESDAMPPKQRKYLWKGSPSGSLCPSRNCSDENHKDKTAYQCQDHGSCRDEEHSPRPHKSGSEPSGSRLVCSNKGLDQKSPAGFEWSVGTPTFDNGDRVSAVCSSTQQQRRFLCFFSHRVQHPEHS
jgi:hypothetical protein